MVNFCFHFGKRNIRGFAKKLDCEVKVFENNCETVVPCKNTKEALKNKKPLLYGLGDRGKILFCWDGAFPQKLLFSPDSDVRCADGVFIDINEIEYPADLFDLKYEPYYIKSDNPLISVIKKETANTRAAVSAVYADKKIKMYESEKYPYISKNIFRLGLFLRDDGGLNASLFNIPSAEDAEKRYTDGSLISPGHNGLLFNPFACEYTDGILHMPLCSSEKTGTVVGKKHKRINEFAEYLRQRYPGNFGDIRGIEIINEYSGNVCLDVDEDALFVDMENIMRDVWHHRLNDIKEKIRERDGLTCEREVFFLTIPGAPLLGMGINSIKDMETNALLYQSYLFAGQVLRVCLGLSAAEATVPADAGSKNRKITAAIVISGEIFPNERKSFTEKVLEILVNGGMERCSVDFYSKDGIFTGGRTLRVKYRRNDDLYAYLLHNKEPVSTECEAKDTSEKKFTVTVDMRNVKKDYRKRLVEYNLVEDNLVNCLAGPGGFFSDGYLIKNKERNIYVFTGTANAGSRPGNKTEEPQQELLAEAVGKMYPGSVTTVRKGFDNSMFNPVSLLVTEGEDEGKDDAVDLVDLLDDFD